VAEVKLIHDNISWQCPSKNNFQRRSGEPSGTHGVEHREEAATRDQSHINLTPASLEARPPQKDSASEAANTQDIKTSESSKGGMAK